MFFISPPFGNYLHFSGTIPIKGSFTVDPRPGLLGQVFKTLRYSFAHGGWINKIGLRNKGLEWGIKNYEPGSILSLALLEPGDLDRALEMVPESTSLELNLSCPNLEKTVCDSGVEKFLNKEREWCIAKMSPDCSEADIDVLYQKGFRQFHFSNTLKTLKGGLSGTSLIPYTSKKVAYTRERYHDAVIIAGGGVRCRTDAKNYLALGANHVSVSTLCFNPFLFTLFWYQMSQNY